MTLIVDCDSHVMEPADLWQTYLEPRYRDRAIRIELVPFVLDVSGLWGERAHVGNASGKQVSTGAKACGDTAAWADETS